MGCAQYAGSNVEPLLKTEGENLAEVLQYFQEERRDLLLNVKEWIEKYTQNDSRIVGIGVSNYDNKVFLNFFQRGKDGKIYPIRGPEFFSTGKRRKNLSHQRTFTFRWLLDFYRVCLSGIL